MGSARHLLDAQSIIMTSHTGFTELYERHHAMVYRAALRVTGNPADAEDVLQIVFLRILNQSGRPDLLQMPKSYFRRAATNAAVDMLRRKAVHNESELDDASPHVAVARRLSGRPPSNSKCRCLSDYIHRPSPG